MADDTDGIIRLIETYGRKFMGNAGSRPSIARNLVIASIRLLAELTSSGEAALAAAEAVGEMAQRDRLAARKLKGDAA